MGRKGIFLEGGEDTYFGNAQILNGGDFMSCSSS